MEIKDQKNTCPAWDVQLYSVFILLFAIILLFSFVRSSVLQERPEEHCSVREVESFHNSSHHVELEDCFKLYTKDEKVSQGQTMNVKNFLNMLFGKSWKTKLTSLCERTAQ